MKAKLARLTASSVGALTMLLAATAAAQDTPAEEDVPNKIALDQFDPSPAGDVFFGLPSPFARGRIVPRGYVAIDYADQPLRISNGTDTSSVVASQMFLHVAASLSLFDRGLISLSLPVALVQGGDALSVDGTDVAAPTSAALGDLRIGARVRIVGDDDGPAQFGAGGYVYVPTGSTEATGSFTGDGSVRIAPHLLFGGRYKLMPSLSLSYTALAGMHIRSSTNPTSVVYGFGVAALLLDDKLQIGPELYASTPIMPSGFTLVKGAEISLNNGTNAELLIGGRYRIWEGLTVGLAGGPGLSQAVGTPSFRFTGMIGWTPVGKSGGSQEESPEDPDKDGITTPNDACPFAAGVESKDAKKNGCPILDDDDDGVPNEQDLCPTEYAKSSDVSDRKGCPPPPPPPDTDGDTIPDEKDACPKEAGPISQDPTKNGCTPPANPDVDGDGVLDAEDACLGEKGVKSSDAKASGCKPLVRLKDRQIVILSPVDFRVTRADLPPIEAASEAVLMQVKETLTEHPEITKVEIGGYTDNTGKEAANVKLSKARAESVKKWLIDHGVAEGRLTAVGYGPAKPIGDNKTKEGRAQNKRIEFAIVDKK
ncbi:MAG: OmpA family protein [Polyangiaceae bacterium]|nr:OmpA family protein [Polyangiaceae bacterium]